MALRSYNFKTFTTTLFLIVLIVFAASIPISRDSQAKILKYENTNDGSGNYYFRYETSNGITREETGRLVNVGQPNQHIVVKGSYTYINSDGVFQMTSYNADTNGYSIKLENPQIMMTSFNADTNGNSIKLENPQIMDVYAVPGQVLASLLGK